MTNLRDAINRLNDAVTERQNAHDYHEYQRHYVTVDLDDLEALLIGDMSEPSPIKFMDGDVEREIVWNGGDAAAGILAGYEIPEDVESYSDLAEQILHLKEALDLSKTFLKEELDVQLSGACRKTEDGTPIREDCDPQAIPHIRRIERLLKTIEKALKL